jgi:hypothetical protein
MATYRFIQSVIESCRDYEQLQSCIAWVERIQVSKVIKAEVMDLIRIKAMALRSW